MKITSKDVDYVAALAHLDLTAEERTRMERDLNSILGYIDVLNELDTTNVAPMAQVMAGAHVDPAGAFAYARRADVLLPSLDHAAALANSPDVSTVKQDDFFKVPKVIER